MKKINYILFFGLLVLASCGKTPDIDNATMLDGDKVFDLSLAHPENYLVSAMYPNPTEAQKNTPVIVAAHGYSATTFEWDELRELADKDKTFLVSQVLLGGHGRTYEDFKKSTWKDWQLSIIKEYKKLDSLGYKKISLIGSSTGCPLIINMVKSGVFSDAVSKPKNIYLIDPIILPSNKTLTLVNTLGPILGYTSIELSGGEQGKWYIYRPYQTLSQLMDLIDMTRKDLQNGITLPAGTKMKTYKAIVDDSADPVSAVLVYKGMKNADGTKTKFEMVDSKLHVFTRLKGREGITDKDRALQTKTFAEIQNFLVK